MVDGLMYSIFHLITYFFVPNSDPFTILAIFIHGSRVFMLEVGQGFSYSWMLSC